MSYEYWRTALKGDAVEYHMESPQCGFYKKKKLGGGWQRVAIWQEEENLVAQVDGGDLISDHDVIVEKIWSYCMDKPISKEVFRAVEAGEPWPDEVPGLGHNAPPAANEFDELKEQIESARTLIDGYAEIETQDQADQAANLRDRLNSLSKEADKQRKTEKQPHLDAGLKIDARWNPLKEAAKQAADWLRGPMGVFIKKEEKVRAEAAAKAAAEHAEKVRKQAPTPIQEVIEAPPEAAPVKIGGATGKRASLRTQKVVVVTDYEACLMAVKDQKDVIAAVEKAATRLAKAGVDVPGVEIKEEKAAA